jgi:two-component sensor histidine kinase
MLHSMPFATRKTSLILTLCGLLLLLIYLPACQNNSRDILVNTKDTATILVHYSAGSAALDTGNKTAALDNYRKGIAQSRKAGNRLYEGFGLHYLATLYGQNGAYDSLSKTGYEAIGIFKKEDYKGHLYLLTRLSLLELYELNSDHVQLTNEGLDILKEAKEVADTPAIARTLDLLSRASTIITEEKKAIAYQEEAVALLRRASDKTTLPKTLNNLGQSYNERGRYEEALAVFYEALQHAAPDARIAGYTYCYMAFAHMGLDQLDSAAFDLKRSRKIADRFADPRIALNIYSAYAELYAFQEKYPEALKILDSGIVLMKEKGINALMPSFQINRAKAFYNMERYKEALAAYGIADSLFAELKEGELQKKIAELETKYKTREQETSIRTLSRTASIQQQWLLIVVLVLLVAIGLGIFALIQYRRQKRANKVISSQAERLQWLMKEIHHRVKNNLQVITSLINMQLRKNDHPDVTRLLSDTVTRIQSIAIIHQKLYQDKEQEVVLLADYIQQLAKAIQAVHGPATVNVQTEIMLDIDTAVLLGLVITELITNSCKHARKADESLVIAIEVTRMEEGYRMIYRDNGPGLPELQGNNRSMGMQLISLMIRQMAGTAQWMNQDGLVCTLYFKDELQRKQIA